MSYRAWNRWLNHIDIPLGGAGCWEWNGPYSPEGQPMARVGRGWSNARTGVYAEYFGTSHDGAPPVSLCGNDRCVRPQHQSFEVAR